MAGSNNEMQVTDNQIRNFIKWYLGAKFPECDNAPLPIRKGIRGEVYAECLQYVELCRKSQEANEAGKYTMRSMYNHKANCVLDRIDKMTNRNYGKDKNETNSHLRP